MDEKELQEQYATFQMYKQQLQQLDKQIAAFDEHIGELQSIKSWVDDMSNVLPGTEMLVPITQGIFVKAVVKDTQNLIVNVGGSATVEKDVSGAKNLLDVQMNEILKAKQQAVTSLQKISALTEKLQQDLAKKFKEEEK